MSFNKAPIKRFNETKDCNVPAPGSYDPHFDSVHKSQILHTLGKCERFGSIKRLNSEGNRGPVAISPFHSGCADFHSRRATSCNSIEARLRSRSSSISRNSRRICNLRSTGSNSSTISLDSNKSDSINYQKESLKEEILQKNLDEAQLKIEELNSQKASLEKSLEEKIAKFEMFKKNLLDQNEALLAETIKNMDSILGERNNELTQVQLEFDKIRMDMANEISSLRSSVSVLKSELDQFHEKNEKLIQERSRLDALIGPFKKQLLAYEAEVKIANKGKETVSADLETVLDKYASLIGHNNSKQKIHHVMNMKDELAKTRKENDKYRSENIRLKQRLLDLERDYRPRVIQVQPASSEAISAPRILVSSAVLNTQQFSSS